MVLELQSITRRFGAQVALDNVSLHVRRGDCYGLIGHNGAGKTTLLRIALGLMPAGYSGRVLLEGHDARRYPAWARSRAGGLIEVPGAYPSLGGRRNLELLGRLAGMGRREARREAERLLERLDLSHAAEKPVGAWSLGMRQRLGIAQALFGGPALLLLDEPMGALDPEGIAQLRETLRSLVDESAVTILVSSHQLGEIEGLCNRVGLLHRGRLVVEEATEVLLAGDRPRLELATDDDGRAASLLREWGCAVREQPRGGLAVEADGAARRELPRRIVDAGLELRRFAPLRMTLEEIYLSATGAAGAVGPAARVEPPLDPRSAVAAASAPPANLPRWGSLRALRHELRRVVGRGHSLALLAVPALVAAAAIAQRRAAALKHAGQVEAETVFSASGVTAFEGVGVGLRAALPLLALLLAGFASQSIAGELSRGTLRNLLLRPLRRAQLAWGKALAFFLAGAGAYAFVALATVAAAAWAFDFEDVAEILPNGARFPLVPAAELWPKLTHALWSPVLPLFSLVLLGFLAGALARSGAGALALGFALLIGLDLVRAVARPLGWELYLPTAHLSTPLGDTSYLAYYVLASTGVSNVEHDYAAASVWVPLAWGIGSLAIAILCLSRRTIP